MDPRDWVVVGAGFVALNLLYGGTVVLSYATYGEDRGGVGAMALATLDSPIGYVVILVALLTAAGAVHLHRRGELV